MRRVRTYPGTFLTTAEGFPDPVERLHHVGDHVVGVLEPGREPHRPPPLPTASSSSGSRLTWVVDAGWVTMLSGPPSEVASRTTRTSSTKARPAS